MTKAPTDLSNLAAQWEAARSSRAADETWAGKTLAQNRANAKAEAAFENTPPSDGIARVRRETKGRGGKAVTVIQGLALNPEELDALAKQLKTLCGSGGTVKDGTVEIQGDHVERVLSALQKLGMHAKRNGG